jgi:hypothetical protein
VWTANSLSADEVAIVPIVKDVIVDTGRHQAGLGDTIEVTVQHLLAWETAGPEGSEAGKKKHDRSSLIAFINGIGLNGVTGTTVIDKKAEWLKLNTQLKAATKDADEQSKKIAELMKQKDKGTDEEKKKLQSEIGELEKAVVESKGRTRELEQKQA